MVQTSLIGRVSFIRLAALSAMGQNGPRERNSIGSAIYVCGMRKGIFRYSVEKIEDKGGFFCA
ncbi:MAG: hypothetical protein PHO18_04015 [Synergistaceae bacterium]|nr:hypothetical protein [Synergistaceae bacterium]